MYAAAASSRARVWLWPQATTRMVLSERPLMSSGVGCAAYMIFTEAARTQASLRPPSCGRNCCFMAFFQHSGAIPQHPRPSALIQKPSESSKRKLRWNREHDLHRGCAHTSQPQAAVLWPELLFYGILSAFRGHPSASKALSTHPKAFRKQQAEAALESRT